MLLALQSGGPYPDPLPRAMMHEANPRLIEAILSRSSLDVEFRRQLLAAPAAAILQHFEVQLPAGFRICFLERDPSFDAVHILPDLHEPDEELSDDDLDAVAGGDPSRWDSQPPSGDQIA